MSDTEAGVRPASRPCIQKDLPSARFLQAEQLLLRRRAGEGSEPWRRGLGPPREMIEDCLDHHWIFDARDHLDRTSTLLAGQDVDLKYPLQPLGPGHRDVARGCGLIGGLCLASAAPGRGDLLTQSMIRCEHAVMRCTALRRKCPVYLNAELDSLRACFPVISMGLNSA